MKISPLHFYRWILVLAIVVTQILLTESANAVESMRCEQHLNDYDRAKLFFTFGENTPGDYSVFAVNDDCYRCSWTFLGNVSSGCVKIWTPFAWKLHLARYNESLTYPDKHYNTLTSLFSKEYTFGDEGVYTINVNGQIDEEGVSTGSFSITENLSPAAVYEPLYILIAVLLAVTFIAFTYEPVLKMIKERGVVEENNATDQKTDGTYSAITASGRQHDYTTVPLLEEGQSK